MTAFLIPTNTTDTTAEILTGTETGVVAPGALLAVTSGSAVALSGTSPLLTVLGTVLTSSVGAAAVGGGAISLTISVGQSGAIMAPANIAIFQNISGNSFRLTNDGLISGNGAVQVSGSATTGQFVTIINNGTLTAINNVINIDNAIEFADVRNSGTINSAFGPGVVHLSTGRLSVLNTGTILAQTTAVESLGDLTLTNTGTMTGNARFASIAFINNSGLIEGSVIDSDQITTAGSEGATVRNAGTITGDVRLGNGNDNFFDLGGTIGGTVQGGAGNDTFHVRDAGLRITDSFGTDDRIFTTVDYRISQGIEALFADTQVGLHLWGSSRAERIEGNIGHDTIEGGSGNDSLFGQSGDDQLFGGRGNDVLTGNALNDTDDNQLFGGDGDDILIWAGAGGIVNGGAGRDVLNTGSLAGLGADVNLQTGTASYVNRATGQVAVTVTLAQIEDVQGTADRDILGGNNGANALRGLDGNDTLNGLSGADTLDGGAGNDSILGGADADFITGGSDDDLLSGESGNDTLRGDAGRDTLTGGSGVDSFAFDFVSDSAVGTPDLINGFDAALERIDLGAIDADLLLPGDDAFAFIGTAAFSGSLAQVRFFQDAGAGQTIVQVKLAGSSVADMDIALSGLLTLGDTNFFL